MGRPSGDLAAAAAAAGLGPSAADLQQQRLYEEALEFAVTGQEGMASRAGSGSSGQRLPLGPAGVGAALSPAAANLMALMSQDDGSGHLQPGVFMPGPPQ
jgi:hypothetical protein